MTAPHANPWLGAIVPISPSTAEDWQRCRRYYRSKHLLHLPGTDDSASTGVGLVVHRLLEAVHCRGCCGQEEAMRAVVAEVDGPGRVEVLVGYLRRHAGRCPAAAAVWSDHEFELARFHRTPPPMWMVTGKIDAAWEWAGLLDARDYKTGAPWSGRVGEETAARVQAYLLAPLAAARGLRLRISYEYLDPTVDEQPEPYEPEDEDLEALQGELSTMVAEISAETAFSGVAFPPCCDRCSYATMCPDAARSSSPRSELIVEIVDDVPGDPLPPEP
jgi:hypothetical protein